MIALSLLLLAAPDAAVRSYIDANRVNITAELFELLSIPNVSKTRDARSEQNADLLVKLLSKRGFEAKKLTVPGAPAFVLGSYRAKGATKTIVLYAHYDGQPVHPEEWASDPFQPVLRSGRLEDKAAVVSIEQLANSAHPDWRIYARSSSDDKGPIVGMLAAFAALRHAGVTPQVNLKIFLDGEEEIGSPHLAALLRRHAKELKADLWIFCDGPRHQSGKPQLAFGVRGHLGAELIVHGATRSLHSGHYGNWAPNPAALLVELLSSMRDSEGRITIDGFDRDVLPISDADREALRSMPAIETQLMKDLSLARHEGAARLEERILLPALNLRGLLSGGVGEGASNSIPISARASLDFRLVPRQDPKRIKALVRKHIEQRGFTVVEGAPIGSRPLVQIEWEDGYPSTRIDPASPAATAVVKALEGALDGPLLLAPTLGGSLPLHHIGEILGAPLVLLPTVNHDNNQHAANENLRLAELWSGIEIYAALMGRLRL
jgi:acetylornithine deacetylase/succinyl-diaminopimelate desuccinylase-like protein